MLSAGIGAVVGFVGVALVRSIAVLLNLTLEQRVSTDLPLLSSVGAQPIILPIAAAGGLVVALMARWAPSIRGHGVPEAMEAVLLEESRVHPRTALAKPFATVVAIGTGAPFGVEGPIIVTGGAIGSLLGQFIRVSPSERKILLAAGAAAGTAVVFGAPIASLFLAVELLLFEFSTRALMPLVVASSIADGIHNAFVGKGPLFVVATQNYQGLTQLPFYIVLGLATGLLAVAITRGVYRSEDLFDRLAIPTLLKPAIGSIGFAVIGLAVPRSLGVGYDVIGDIFTGRVAGATLAAVFAAKLAAWWIAMGSGTSGSSLAPILLVGAAGSGLLGDGAHELFPTVGVTGASFAIVGAAATFGAAAGAPLTSIVLVIELTRDFDVIVPVMIATVVAQLIASLMMSESLMTEKLARRGLWVPRVYRPAQDARFSSAT